jgi:hypothetical protein
LDVLVEDFIKPTFIKLSSIIIKIVRDKSPNKKVELCAMSNIVNVFTFAMLGLLFSGCGIKKDILRRHKRNSRTNNKFFTKCS